jgi:hypothetical protein
MALNSTLKTIFSVTLFAGLSSCSAFKYGYTQSQALDSYYLVTGDADNFGDRRIKYNQGFHKNSPLATFLTNHERPNFIYEYKNSKKCEGIKLYFNSLDSVYIFEEYTRGGIVSLLKEARKMDSYERETFVRLQAGK